MTQGPGSPYGQPSPSGLPHQPGQPGQQDQPGQPASPRRPVGPWIVGVCGCLVLLLVAIGGGALAVILSQRSDDEASADPSATSSSDFSSKPPETPPPFTPADPYEKLTLSEQETREVLQTNPLTRGTLPTAGECDLPKLAAKHSDDELEAFLNAGESCLTQVWSTASSDRSMPWATPSIVVYSWPDVPKSSCEKDTFERDYPRVCNLDNTIYWPADYDASDSKDPAEDYPAHLMWGLALVQQTTVMWQSSIGLYYQHLDDEVGDDQKAQDEAHRRYVLQNQCMAAATVMQLPDGARPSAALQKSVLDAPARKDNTDPTISEDSQDAWIRAGLESEGDLGACNSWTAESSDVS